MNKKVAAIATVILGIAFLVAVSMFDWNSINFYKKNTTDSLNYVRARVVSITSESVTQDSADPELYLGEQEISVEILEGDQAGETVTFTNYLTAIHSIFVEKNTQVIVCADTPENASPYYTIFNYDRSTPLMCVIVFFAFVMILIGGRKGIGALLGVGFSVLTVILFMAQAIFHGFNPIAITLLTVLISTGVSLLLLNGFSRRTASGVISTLAGVGVTAIVFLIAASTLHLTGYNTETAEDLLMIQDATGLSVRYLLIAAVLISAMGAVMDVAVSLAAALEELVSVNPTMTRRDLFKSGMNIGKDMIGTMSNTLILAFAGTALNTIICLLGYGYSMTQLFSSDYLTVEITEGLCATIGVILTVPVSAMISSLFFIKKEEKKVVKSVKKRKK